MADNALTRTFPAEVHDSLAELRKLAKTVRSRAEWEERGRRATPEEVALAETLRKPNHCNGKSARTGLPCTMARVRGLDICQKHGGAIPAVKQKAALKLAEAVDPVLTNMIRTATQTENLQAAVKAGADVLDRAGIGEVVAAKVRASTEPKQGGYDPNRASGFIGYLNVFLNAPLDVRQGLQDGGIPFREEANGNVFVEAVPALPLPETKP